MEQFISKIYPIGTLFVKTKRFIYAQFYTPFVRERPDIAEKNKDTWAKLSQKLIDEINKILKDLFKEENGREPNGQELEEYRRLFAGRLVLKYEAKLIDAVVSSNKVVEVKEFIPKEAEIHLYKLVKTSNVKIEE